MSIEVSCIPRTPCSRTSRLRVSAALGAVWSITHDLEAVWMGGGAVDGIAVVETIAENALSEHLALDAVNLHLAISPFPVTAGQAGEFSRTG